MSAPVDVLAADVLERARHLGVMIAAAESCTGGLVGAALTSVAGSSDVFDRGFITYSNTAKADMLGVSAALIVRFGAVSAEVARSMAEGALARSRATLAVSITGIAGPGGGGPGKPVGLVHFATARRTIPAGTLGDPSVDLVHHEARYGDLERNEIRAKAVETALVLLRNAMQMPA